MTLTDNEKEQIVLQATLDFLQSPASPLAAAAAATATATNALSSSSSFKKEAWKAKQLSGGYTNAAYQVYFNENDEASSNEVGKQDNNASSLTSLIPAAPTVPTVPSIFCKLAFRNTSAIETMEIDNVDNDSSHNNNQHAQHVWNHQRTNCEYQIMQYIQNHNQLRDAVPIPVPYACLDVCDKHKCKLLLTEWTVRRQVWAEQFLVGQRMDRHLITQVATAFASLNAHCGYPFDSDFNPSGRAYQASVMPVARQVFSVLLEQKRLRPTDRVAACIQQYGATVCDQIANAMEHSYMQDRQCLLHGDAHAFNVLIVNNNNNNNSDKSTGAAKCRERDATTIRVIDWELCIVGPVGRDIGLLMGWPIACAVWHAHQGREKIALNVLTLTIDLLWSEYAKQLVKNGIDKKELAPIYRNGLAWCGWFLFVSLYVFGVVMEHFTYESDTEEEHEKVLESIGLVGLHLMRLGFCVQEHPKISLSDLQKQMKRIIELELFSARPLPPRPPPRKKLRQRKQFPPMLRSLSVTSWSSLHSFEFSDSDEDNEGSSHNDHTQQRRTQSYSMLPRHCVSAITDGEAPPKVLTPTGSSLPFVIPVKGKSQKPKTFKFVYR